MRNGHTGAAHRDSEAGPPLPGPSLVASGGMLGQRVLLGLDMCSQMLPGERKSKTETEQDNVCLWTPSWPRPSLQGPRPVLRLRELSSLNCKSRNLLSMSDHHKSLVSVRLCELKALLCLPGTPELSPGLRQQGPEWPGQRREPVGPWRPLLGPYPHGPPAPRRSLGKKWAGFQGSTSVTDDTASQARQPLNQSPALWTWFMD